MPSSALRRRRVETLNLFEGTGQLLLDLTHGADGGKSTGCVLHAIAADISLRGVQVKCTAGLHGQARRLYRSGIRGDVQCQRSSIWRYRMRREQERQGQSQHTSSG